MPGIAGVIGARAEGDGKPLLDAMVGTMVHEDFYTSATYNDAELEVHAGAAAHGGSFADCMPLWNEAHDVCLIFSGETYPDAAELDALRQAGHDFDSGNASYIVHLYEQFGAEFLSKLNGWFSGVLIDRRSRRVLLFCDRYGVNRVFFHEAPNGVFFASEAKSLLKVLPGLRQLDVRSVGEFLACGCVLQERSLFAGISMLPPAAVWTFSPGEPIRKESFFSKGDWESQSELNEDDYYAGLKEIWARILPSYFRGAPPLGLSLTGGVDSRMILAWAAARGEDLHCYTFCGNIRECHDVTIARTLADMRGHPFSALPVRPEFFNSFSELAARTVYLSDGSVDVTAAIDLHLQKAAREISPVRISGVYGGEILRRLVVFKPFQLSENLLAPELHQAVDDAFATYAGEREMHPLSFTAFKQARWYMTGKFAIERSQVSIRTPYFSNELVAHAYRAPAACRETNQVSLRLIGEGDAALSEVSTDRGLTRSAVPGATAVKHLFQQFMFKAEYAFDYGMPQAVAKVNRLLAPLQLERLFLGRHGIQHYRTWYANELAGSVREILLDARTLSRSYLNRKTLEQIVLSHTAGSRNYTVEIGRMMALELIQRELIEDAR